MGMKKIFILYSCDAWKSYSSMETVLATTSIRALRKKIKEMKKDVENGKVNEEVSEIQCRTFGKIRESVEKNAKLWRTVRVVGRLAHFKGKLALVAEMVEFAR